MLRQWYGIDSPHAFAGVFPGKDNLLRIEHPAGSSPDGSTQGFLSLCICMARIFLPAGQLRPENNSQPDLFYDGIASGPDQEDAGER